ncbi:MAG: GTPase Era [Flavobacteriales bacterium]|nr:GTPase Era [Flavobacteriales bacterium]
MVHKSGFVNIIGNPNAGKSTLINLLVGEKISIINAKAQTTRHRIMGIVNDKDFQIIYSDTPGLLKPAYKLQEGMMRFVDNALQDADLFLLVVDINEKELNDEKILEILKNTSTPVFVLLNKVDTSRANKTEEMLVYWKGLLPNAEVFLISALHHFNIEVVKEKIIKMLPEHPPFFPKEDNEITDKTERFLVSEIIREKVLDLYHKEIPYSTEIVMVEFKEKEKLFSIRAEIRVERDSQKGIIIGHRGEALKKLGTIAREEIETFLGKKVFLDLHVKVDKNWRNEEQKLKRYGYWT